MIPRRVFVSLRQTALPLGLASLILLASMGAPVLPAASKASVSDYVQYWAASRLVLSGENPYDWHRMLAMEQQVQPSLRTPILMWNPPWTLALCMLPSLLPYPWSFGLWFSVCSLILIVASRSLWDYWGGPPTDRALAVALGWAFAPSCFALAMGQVSPIMLLGIVGFLFFERQRRFTAAGAFAALTLVKPHVVYLWWIGVVLWSIHERRWRVLAGALLAVGAASAVSMLPNQDVFLQYLHLLSEHPPDYWVTPTIGSLLRLLLGWETVWPSVVPALVGVAWFLAYWSRNRDNWIWSNEVSLVLLISVLTSPYTWLFDQIVLLLPVLQLASSHVRRRSPATSRGIVAYVVAVGLAFVLWPWPVIVAESDAYRSSGLLRHVLSTPNMFWQVIVAPLLLVGFYVGLRRPLGVANKG